jgi:phage-related protein
VSNLGYTTKIKNFVYVLHVFQKKSKRGIKTPKKEVEIVRKRLKEVFNRIEQGD